MMDYGGGGGLLLYPLSSDSSPLGNKYVHSYTPVYGAEKKTLDSIDQLSQL